MKKYLFGCLTLLMAFFSCKKEVSRERGTGGPPEIKSEWEFKEADLNFSGPMDSAYIITYQAGYEELFMMGSSPDVEGEIILRLVATDIIAQEYRSPYVLFQYAEDGLPLMQSNPANTDDFIITITSIDSASVKGTFSGKIIDGLGNTRTVTEGKFTAAITSEAVEPPPTGSGELTVWSKALCSGGGNITVKVGDQTASITQAFSGEPFCGSAGTADLTLPVGSYTVKAFCGTDSVMYDVLITENNCTLLEVDFANPPDPQDYFPLKALSTWNYEEAGGDVGKVTSIGPVVFDSKTYARFDDHTGSSRYYRKEPHIYYEYAKLDFNGAVTDAPDVEYIILKDDAALNASWETAEYDLLISGLREKAKLKSTVTARDFDRTINGEDYNDLIEVFTELLLYNPISGYTPASSYTTIYAKGVGVVYFENPDSSEIWNITSYALTP